MLYTSKKIRTKIQNYSLQWLQGQRAEADESANYYCAVICTQARHPAVRHGRSRAYREEI